MFKQFLMSGAMVKIVLPLTRFEFCFYLASYFQGVCQIDSARMAGVNEVIAVYLMAAKLGVPVSKTNHGGYSIAIFQIKLLLGPMQAKVFALPSMLQSCGSQFCVHTISGW